MGRPYLNKLCIGALFLIGLAFATASEDYTLALQVDSQSSTFGYDSEYWTNWDEYSGNGELKTSAFFEPADAIKITYTTQDDVTRSIEIYNEQGTSLREIFESGIEYSLDTSNTGHNFRNLCNQPGGCNWQSYMCKAGFNIVTKWKAVRLGVIWNNEHDCNSPDIISGLGFRSGGSLPVTHGNFVGCCGRNSSPTLSNVIIRVYISNWRLAMRIHPGSRSKTNFGPYSNAWTSNSLLRTPLEAKTSAYFEKADKIRVTFNQGHDYKSVEFELSEPASLYEKFNLPYYYSSSGDFSDMPEANKITLATSSWHSSLPNGNQYQNNCNLAGFRVKTPAASVNLGIVYNNENNCESPDSISGLGLQLRGKQLAAGDINTCCGVVPNKRSQAAKAEIWIYHEPHYAHMECVPGKTLSGHDDDCESTSSRSQAQAFAECLESDTCRSLDVVSGTLCLSSKQEGDESIEMESKSGGLYCEKVGIECEDLGTIEGGAVSVTNDGNYPSLATFVCDEGFTLEETSDLPHACLSTGKWAGETPSCKGKTCEEITCGDHCSVTTTNDNVYPSTATFLCDDGYLPGSENVFSCNTDGTWEHEAPTCEPRLCNELTLEGGSITYTNDRFFPSSLKAQCDAGYEMSGIDELTCVATDGTWNGELGSCQGRLCETLAAPDNGQVVTTNNNMYPSFAAYVCDDGYLPTSSNERECQTDGTWNGNMPECGGRLCEELATPDNGNLVISNDQKYPATATFSCQAGYELIGNDQRTCNADGTWTGEQPVCKGLTCDAVHSPINGAVTASNGGEFPSTATYTCNEGYEVDDGDATRTCDSTGAWDGKEPTCRGILCADLEEVENGEILLTLEGRYPSRATLTCTDGYTVYPDEYSNRACQSDGSWDGDTPVCRGVEGDELVAAANEQVAVTNDNRYPSTASYEADQGFELVGDVTREMNADGTWSGEEPTVQGVLCDPISDPVGGSVSKTSDRYPATATTTCEDGYTLEGSETRECQTNGAWSGSTATCQDINECETDNGGCDELTTCVNTAGGRTCGACPSGYDGDGYSGCEDINECNDNNGGCHEMAECTNTPGSRDCGPCADGYEGDGEGSQGCLDINECLDNHGDCDELVTCTNTEGSHECGACPEGYSGTGDTECVDVNECEGNNGGCDFLTTCENTIGSRTCGSCPDGYTGNGESGCEDIDECAHNNGGCHRLTRCANTPGSRLCSTCPLGYTTDPVTEECIDEDECVTNNGGCDDLTVCHNTIGGRMCGDCPSGYTGSGENGCLDINECEEDNGGCDTATDCTNTPGSRICGPCPHPLEGHGSTGCWDPSLQTSNSSSHEAIMTEAASVAAERLADQLQLDEEEREANNNELTENKEKLQKLDALSDHLKDLTWRTQLAVAKRIQEQKAAENSLKSTLADTASLYSERIADDASDSASNVYSNYFNPEASSSDSSAQASTDETSSNLPSSSDSPSEEEVIGSGDGGVDSAESATSNSSPSSSSTQTASDNSGNSDNQDGSGSSENPFVSSLLETDAADGQTAADPTPTNWKPANGIASAAYANGSPKEPDSFKAYEPGTNMKPALVMDDSGLAPKPEIMHDFSDLPNEPEWVKWDATMTVHAGTMEPEDEKDKIATTTDLYHSYPVLDSGRVLSLHEMQHPDHIHLHNSHAEDATDPKLEKMLEQEGLLSPLIPLVGDGHAGPGVYAREDADEEHKEMLKLLADPDTRVEAQQLLEERKEREAKREKKREEEEKKEKEAQEAAAELDDAELEDLFYDDGEVSDDGLEDAVADSGSGGSGSAEEEESETIESLTSDAPFTPEHMRELQHKIRNYERPRVDPLGVQYFTKEDPLPAPAKAPALPEDANTARKAMKKIDDITSKFAADPFIAQLLETDASTVSKAEQSQLRRNRIRSTKTAANNQTKSL